MTTNAPLDPLQALSAALAVLPNSKEQSDLLNALRENLEAHPNPIPILCTTLIKTLTGAGESLLKRWVLDLLHFAIARSSLQLNARTQLAAQSLEVLSGLLDDVQSPSVKVVIQCFSSIYPLLFRSLCTNRSARQQWDILSASKSKILGFVWTPNINEGIKLSAVKFMQRVILVQTRAVVDPRLQNKNDPNIAQCPADHPFIPVAALEAEAGKLVEAVITILYTSSDADTVSAILNSWGTLAKLRPSQTHLIISALSSWTPTSLGSCTASTVKSVEKAVRILLIHLSRTPQGSPFAQQIQEALAQQVQRMEQAALAERNRKAAVTEENRKRPIAALGDDMGETKRARIEEPNSGLSAVLASFDFTALPAQLVTEIIVANLQAMPPPVLQAAIQTYRRAHAPLAISASPSGAVTIPATSQSAEPEPARIKEEAQDPLQMDIDEEEINYEPEKLNLELSENNEMDEDVYGEDDVDAALSMSDFALPAPQPLDPEARLGTLKNAMTRIWSNSSSSSAPHDAPASLTEGAPGTDLWMLLLVRMVTRVIDYRESKEDPPIPEHGVSAELSVQKQDHIRQTICNYIIADFPSRARLATIWMNEEWYNDRVKMAQDPNAKENYQTWLRKLTSQYELLLDFKDRTLTQFLLDIPSIPAETLDLLEELCTDPERMPIGFTTLREFVIQRPPLRTQSMKILLELSTHPEKVTRGAAIITVKRWVPAVAPMNDMVRNFALSLLRRLQSKSSIGRAGDTAGDAMEDGEMPPEEVVQTKYLPSPLEIPATKKQVLQHVELIFALCTKIPDFLDEIFASYGEMHVSVQEAVQDLITQLIKSLGPNNGKLLTLMRTFPPGAESLALRVLSIFTENGRPSAPLVALVKGLLAERENLDPRFLVAIIAEMDKPDIIRHLPRIVSTLNGTSEMRNMVKSVFSGVVTTPPQTFGSVTSNQPRVRQSELLTPAELMVLLHESEKEIGLKSAIEAIGICFSMTDVFRSEILAVVMQQIVDEPSLPVLFLRTVIQAVKTYKTLVGFVSTTLLSRLITKSIWKNPPLWEGFIRCASAIAPQSFGALLQLPKEQLRELVDKQPNLKAGLREFVMKKAGNKQKQNSYLDLLSDDPTSSSTSQPPSSIPTPPI